MTGAALKGSRAKAAPAGPSPSWEEDALGFLIAPVTPEAFLGRYYEREALVNIRGEPERYADLLTLEILDHFINSADLREGMIDLTSQKKRMSRDDYVEEGGRVSRIAIAEEYLDGATIILPQLHDSIFKLGEFCRALEELFSCHMQTNIYLTPSGNQGFPIHYDNHDVFVMQVSGAKAWRLYGVPVETPFRGERFELGQHEPGPVSQQFTLNPGDCVYVPRGMMHDAENVGEEPSLHITVGLITKTWADLMLESISELALTSPDMRRSLPAGFAGRDFDREAARAQFDRLRREIADKASMDSAFDLLADNFVRGRRPNVVGRDLGRRLRPAAGRPLPAPPLRAVERRRRRGQIGADRPRRRPGFRGRGRRRARHRFVGRAVRRRGPQVQGPGRADQDPVVGRLSRAAQLIASSS